MQWSSFTSAGGGSDGCCMSGFISAAAFASGTGEGVGAAGAGPTCPMAFLGDKSEESSLQKVWKGVGKFENHPTYLIISILCDTRGGQPTPYN